MAEGAEAAPIAAPHSPQNFSSGWMAAPHLGQEATERLHHLLDEEGVALGAFGNEALERVEFDAIAQ
jgi:hypothetical protein